MAVDQNKGVPRDRNPLSAAFRVANAPCSFGVMAGFEPDPPLTYVDVLDQISSAGFHGTELGDWGFMPCDPPVLRRELDQRQLALVGAFTPVELTEPANLPEARSKALRAARLLSACTSPAPTAPYLILAADSSLHPTRRRIAGNVKEAHGLSDAEMRAAGQATNEIARTVLDETGVRTVFHPHCGTSIETALETSRFALMTDPELVGLCFDTGHVVYAGDDPREWLSVFGKRTKLVHFKDMDASVARMARSNAWDYTTSVRRGLFCPLGRGSIDFAAVLEDLVAAGHEGWIVVEDEMPPGRISPFEAALQDREFLRGLGL